MTDDPRAAAFELALEALADIGTNTDLDRTQMQDRARCVYGEVRALLKAAQPAETKDCKPFEDWRGANEDWRKEK